MVQQNRGSQQASSRTPTGSPLGSPTVGAFTAAGVDPYSTVSASATSRSQTQQLQTQSTLADSLRALRENSLSSLRTASTSDLRSAGGTLSSTRRKATPSPLQHSSSTQYFSTKSVPHDYSSTVSSPRSPVSPLYTPTLESPRLSENRPHALQAPDTISYSYRLDSGGLQSRSISDSLATPTGPAYSYGSGIRKTSAPLPSTVSNLSPPATPTAMSVMVPTKPSRDEPRPAVARNPSIDSQTSSISSEQQHSSRSTPSNLHRPSQEAQTSQSQPQQQLQQDLASFVASTGSVEAAIQSLWKEKQSSTAHNAQLWRLVEKQRAMILGLNKDLERALKDKERYRKKLKEHLAQQPPLPNGLHRIDSGLEGRAQSHSPAPSERYDLAGRESVMSDVSYKPMQRADSDLYSVAESPVERVSQTASQGSSNPSPKELGNANQTSADSSQRNVTRARTNYNMGQRNQANTSHNAAPAVQPPAQNDAHVGAQNVNVQHSNVSQNPKTPDLHPAPLSIKPHGKPNAPTVSLTEPTPVIGTGTFTQPSAPPSMAAPRPPILTQPSTTTPPISPAATSPNSARKAPPAPLNLSKPATTSAHLHQQQPGEHSDSDYDDTLEDADGKMALPPVLQERGRRKTREEDDAMREAQYVLKSPGAQIQGSKKSKSKSKSQPTSPQSHAPAVGAPEPGQNSANSTNSASSQAAATGLGFIGLPASPRISQAAGSINALLSPANSDTSSSGRGRGSMGSLHNTPPLPSPGLPSSPRPMSNQQQAPIGLPMSPRASKASFGNTPPLSPRPGGVGIAAGAMAGAMPLSPRAPKQPIPLPPSSPLASETVHPQRAEVHALPQPSDPPQKPPPPPPVQVNAPESHKRTESDESAVTVYEGLMDDRYPGLLLPPNALPSIDVKVFSSRMRPSRHSMIVKMEEDPVFQLGIYAHSSGKQLWRAEKTTSALARLHQLLVANVRGFEAQLPDRVLFSGHAPAKIDARRDALNAYFGYLLDTEMDERMAVEVCRFFSDNVIEPEQQTSQAGSLQIPPQDLPRQLQVQKPVAAAPSTAAGNPKERVPKEGYLTKRGKNFGGWKARYFVLEGSSLTYYDAPGGQEIGRIKLVNAQIGKQQSSGGHTHNRSTSADDSAPEDNEYRHAFLVLEPKRKDEKSLVRHVLCAESDEERDAWVESLLQYVDARGEGNDASQPQPQQPSNQSNRKSKDGHATSGRSAMETQRERMMLNVRDSSSSAPPRSRGKDSKRSTPDTEKPDAFQSMSYEEMVPQQAPVRGPSRTGLPSPPLNGGFSQPPQQQQQQQQQYVQIQPTQPPSNIYTATQPTVPGPQPMISGPHPAISGPTGGAKIEDASIWGNKAPSVKDKKRSIFGFRGRSSSDLDKNEKPGSTGPVNAPAYHGAGHAVFGIPLAEAVELTQPAGVDIPLPAVVYRCLEYLRTQGAVREEGIFRLSGSNTTIRGLRDRFNTEGDVRLLEGDFYDVHAVASLLKLYLRELPASVLTRELHIDFLKALGMSFSLQSDYASSVMCL